MCERKEELSLTERANAAFLLAAKQAVKIVQQTGTPIILWEQGGIKQATVEEMVARLAAIEKGAKPRIEQLPGQPSNDET